MSRRSGPGAEAVTLALTCPAATWAMVAEGLLDLADQRRRAGIAASGELEVERLAGKDIRTGATRVVRVLAEADTFERIARVIHDNLGTMPAGGESVAQDVERPAAAQPSPPPASATVDDAFAAEARLAELEAAVLDTRVRARASAPAAAELVTPAGEAVWFPDVDAVLDDVGEEEGVEPEVVD